MAATTNGPMDGQGGGDQKFIDTVDPDDPDYIKNLQKPPNIREDMHEMDRRKRVSQIMNSNEFRRELEDIIDFQLRTGHNPNSTEMLQQISNFLMSKPQVGGLLEGRGGGSSSTAPIIPVADLRGPDAAKYSKLEKMLRCKLASMYRLVDLLGWSHGVYNHITLRITQDMEHFLINPFGLMYQEVTASSLVKVNLQGEIVDGGSTALGVNQAGYTIHSAIHSVRPDIKCVIHLHNQAVAAVSSMQCGLLPLCQEACIVGEVSYHDYQGIILSEEEKDAIMRKFSEGSRRKVMILRNHGALACGESAEEAFHFAFNIVHACETQIRAMSGVKDVNQLVQVSEEIRDRVYEVANRGGGGVDSAEEKKKWKVGQLEFEAYMRMMDNAGFRTGYMYALPNLKGDKGRGRGEDDIMYPPASQSYSFYDDDAGSPHKQYVTAMKKVEKSKWMNSPNVYQKVEFEETGTQDPKKITKWVQGSGSPTHSTPIKIENSNQFIPSNTDIAEFKQLQQKLKSERRQDRISSGPQSKVLDGVTWDEANQLQDSDLSGTQDKVIVIGAASKGIVQRDHQHNAQVYRSYYANNPFDNVTEEELDAYKREIERKQKGLPPEAEDGKRKPPPTAPRPAGGAAPSQPATATAATATTTDNSVPLAPLEPRSPASDDEGDRAINGEAEDRRKSSTMKSEESAEFSRSSKEGSPTKEHPDEKEHKKKKKGFRTPSFLKGKKKDKGKGKDEGGGAHPAEAPPAAPQPQQQHKPAKEAEV